MISRFLDVDENEHPSDPPVETELPPDRGAVPKIATTLRVPPVTMARTKLFLELVTGKTLHGPAQIAKEAFLLLEDLALSQYPELQLRVPDVTTAIGIVREIMDLNRGRNRTLTINALKKELPVEETLETEALRIKATLKGGDQNN